ncbi:MAG: Bug family tripartite tricarboxylate transporter substrate binding protein [Hyphomicrobiaceae bacterium]
MSMQRILGMIAGIAAAAAAVPANADDIADFYKGRSVTLIVGSSAGGGYDAYGRLVGAHLGKHIPGNPNVIIQNMPGAGQSLAVFYVYARAPKDGTAIAVTSPGALLSPLVGGPRVQYDPMKLKLVGSANTEVYACFVRTDAPVKSFKEAFDKELILGVSSGTTRDMPLITKAILKTKYKFVTGYKGSKEVNLAIERGEVHGLCGLSYASFRTQNPNFRQEGKIKVFAQESVKGHPELNKEGVPKIIDFATNDRDRQALALVFNQGQLGRVFAAAPEVPEARFAALRKAFADTMKDPALIADARKRKLDVDWLSGAELDQALKEAYGMPKDVVNRVRSVLDVNSTKNKKK